MQGIAAVYDGNNCYAPSGVLCALTYNVITTTMDQVYG
jgi:hypothetical protein